MTPALLLLLALLIQLFVRPLLAAYLFTRPPRLRPTFRTPADWGADYREVEFGGGGGIRLAGWYIPSRNGAAVVLLHGHSGNRLAVAYHAEALSRAGYGVLLFDLRAHGHSGGKQFTRGAAAVEDVLGAVAFVSRQPDVSGRIGVMGVSAGGMMAIQAAGRTGTIRAVAADGPILSTTDDLPPPAGLFDRLWRYPMERYYQAAIDRLAPGPRPPANTVVLSRLRRPILLISAGRGFERRLTEHFFRAAPRGMAQWWEVPRAGHANGWLAEPEAYGRELVAFFERAFFAPALVAPEPEVGGAGATAPELPAEPPVAEERTISPPAAMMIAFATIPAALLLLAVPYQLRWGVFAPRPPAGDGLLILFGLLLLLAAGVAAHEFVHWLGYRLFGRVPPGAARLQMGGVPLSPQVRCAAPIRAGAYRRMLALPGLLLGVLPGVTAVLVGSWVLLVWGVWMMVLAGGDAAALWAMRGVPSAAPVRTHPTRVGCLVLSNAESVQNIDNSR